MNKLLTCYDQSFAQFLKNVVASGMEQEVKEQVKVHNLGEYSLAAVQDLYALLGRDS